MICQGCLNEKNINNGNYCAACKKALFDGRTVSSFLGFDKQQYINFRAASEGRFSISGVQPKIILKQNGTDLEPVTNSGTHLLKPAPLSYNIPRFPDEVPANEHLTMQIAGQIFRIPVAKNCFIRLKSGEPAYLTKRFDRMSDGTKIPQEDFCQLMKISEETNGKNYKYNFSYETASKIITRFCSSGIVEMDKFFQLILFNYVISNGDAHLKNFSLQQSTDGDYLLTPAYDLLCTTLHFPDESRTALDLFDDFETKQYSDNGFYTGACFLKFAEKLSIRKSFAKRTISSFFEKERLVADIVNRSMLSLEAKKDYISMYKERLKALGIS
ncbi:MAG TPA: HipA domain-containing protein [bacterium]|nr:HipA domain-containing protein [bacterium]HPS31320.1 HipA domain-containing protein [bacterium]